MISKEEIFVNERYWVNMSDDELNEFVDKIFQYYRENGFPYFPEEMSIRRDEFNKFMKYDRSKIFEDDNIKQSMHGLSLAWSYFPHSFNVRCNNSMSPLEAFNNDELFKKIIRKRLKMGTYISDSGIRKMLKIHSGVQGVSNFRPTAAAAIYDAYSNSIDRSKRDVVWDMSGGWGGRLLGAIASGVDTYIATEPSKLTYDGLVKLADDFGCDINTEIHCMGSEDYKPSKNSLDLCFTSPPYFDVEKYSNEPTQSYIKYNTKEKWLEEFLRPTFNNCYYGLKDYRFMLINIADQKGKSNLNLEGETIRIAGECGFKLVNKHQLLLSNVNLKEKEIKHKFEPIFVFRKHDR